MTDDNDQNFKKTVEFNAIPELQHAIHRDWGLYHKHRHQWTKATENFDKSLQINQKSFRPMLEKSYCLLNECNASDALAIAEQCHVEHPNIVRVEYHRNNCLYEQNRFEDSLKMAWQTYNKNPIARKGKGEIELINTTIEQSIDVPKNCLHNMRKNIDRLQRHKLEASDSRPMWKKLRENDQCDVVSIRSELNADISPIAEQRRKASINRIHAMYLDSTTAKDVNFLKHLTTDKRLILKQTQRNNAILLDNINKCLANVDICEKMLWSREPCYAKTYTENPARKNAAKLEQLRQAQYHTRINAFIHLTEIKRLQKTNFIEMLRWIEKIMSTTYATKTVQHFPRKFEFFNEIYNIVGIAYLNRLHVPNIIMQIPQCDRMNLLLAIDVNSTTASTENNNDAAAIEMVNNNPIITFADRTAFVDPEAPDDAYLAYKRKIDHFENRLRYSEYPIEKCYLYHEMTQLHLKHRKLDETKQLARKMIELAKNCGNFVWIVNGYLAMIRVDLAQTNPRKIGQKLRKLMTIQEFLNAPIVHYLKTAIMINKEDENAKFRKSF